MIYEVIEGWDDEKGSYFENGWGKRWYFKRGDHVRVLAAKCQAQAGLSFPAMTQCAIDADGSLVITSRLGHVERLIDPLDWRATRASVKRLHALLDGRQI